MHTMVVDPIPPGLHSVEWTQLRPRLGWTSFKTEAMLRKQTHLVSFTLIVSVYWHSSIRSSRQTFPYSCDISHKVIESIFKLQSQSMGRMAQDDAKNWQFTCLYSHWSLAAVEVLLMRAAFLDFWLFRILDTANWQKLTDSCREPQASGVEKLCCFAPRFISPILQPEKLSKPSISPSKESHRYAECPHWYHDVIAARVLNAKSCCQCISWRGLLTNCESGRCKACSFL